MDARIQIASAICVVALAVYGTEKKIIGHSWDLLAIRPEDVVRNLDALKGIPLDGISLTIKKELPDGVSIGYNSIMRDPKWDKKWFSQDVKTVQQCSSRNLKHNFLISFWAPQKRLAWNDDAAWARFAHNIGVFAWLAREGRAKGIMIDHEDYTKARQYFLADNDAPYAKTAALARRRGAQVMESIAAEYPDITLLSFWMFSFHPNWFRDEDPVAAAAEASDLWPAFLNGMLSALPPNARMIDGNEHGYLYEAAKRDFYMSSVMMQNKALKLVDDVNRIKYTTQVLAGFGLYLDMYTNPNKPPYYFGELNGSRLNHLRSNFAQALDAAQEYVWIYGEKMDWIKWKGTGREKNPTWEEGLPGFLSTLGRLRNPRQWAEKFIAEHHLTGKPTNCIANAACTLAKVETTTPFRQGVLPGGWWGWQDDKVRQGIFGTDTQKGRKDNFSLCAVGVAQGSFGTSCKAAPGNEFIVEAYAQGDKPSLTIAWKRSGTWDWSLPRTQLRFSKAGSDGWRQALGTVEVPEGADELVVMLNVRQAEGERTWFDDVGLYLLSDQH